MTVLPDNIDAIMHLIPHRPPFLLVDRVVSRDGNRLVAEHLVRPDAPWLAGHFPGRPVVPGVLLAEGAAQACCVLAAIQGEKYCTETLLTEITEARFRRSVVPGETVRYEVTLIKRRGSFAWYSATVMVGNETAVTLSLNAKVS